MSVGESIPTENNTGLIPIYKKAGARLYPANYQLANVSSVICMLMESIIKDALTGYLDVDDIISPYQHGFMSDSSRLNNLPDRAMDEESGIDILFLRAGHSRTMFVGS